LAWSRWVWGVCGYKLAREGARLFDSLQILSGPIGRAFTGEQQVMGPFFFLNLFAHIAIPLGMGLVLWLHVSRIARPVLLPPRKVYIAATAALVVLAVAWPIGMLAEANPFALTTQLEVDPLFGWWMLAVRRMPPAAGLVLIASIIVFAALVPLMVKRRKQAVAPPSVVDEDVCVGCEQCALDCP